MNNNNKYRAMSGVSVVMFIAIVFIALWFTSQMQQRDQEITYSQFVRELKDGNVAEAIINQSKSVPTGTVTVTLSNPRSSRIVYVSDVNEVQELLVKYDIDYQMLKVQEDTMFTTVVLPVLITMAGVLLIFALMNRQGGGANAKAMNFGKSRARLNSPADKQVTFAEVAGLKEEKEELEEIVDFLKAPKKYIQVGARIPKGVLLEGPPGTGKTLLAKAIAGEAGVPFFSISGSDFVEMFVGVGASRVRDLFEQAKKSAPSIVFIDEIDAVGRKRGAGMGGGHDEREQTLNQLLVEMDGFAENDGVIIIAATNRPDILDRALLRPGRFDRQVVVDVPDVKGREAILQVHSARKPLAQEVDLAEIAKATSGYSGADLENLMNEAAIFAARRNHSAITKRDVEDANLKVMMGSEKRSRIITEKERRLTAFHEAGHAVLARLADNNSHIHKVSIVPRGRAGGFTMHVPDEDKMYTSKNDMLDEIVVLLGGRVAEALTMNDISTGASSDIQRATELARNMVTKYAMSDVIGPVSYDDGDEVFIGRDFAHSKTYSEKTAADIDDEVKHILMSQYEKTQQILTDNMEILTRIANKLLEKETIDGIEFEECFNSQEGGNTNAGD